MTNDEIKAFERLTGIATMRRVARRHFHEWSEEQTRRILFLIELVNREMKEFIEAAHRTENKALKKPPKMKTFHEARMSAERPDLEELLKDD